MQTILEALSKWRPPGGSALESASVSRGPGDGYLVSARIRRGSGDVLAVEHVVDYYDAMTATAGSLALRLTNAAVDAWHHAGPPASPGAAPSPAPTPPTPPPHPHHHRHGKSAPR